MEQYSKTEAGTTVEEIKTDTCPQCGDEVAGGYGLAGGGMGPYVFCLNDDCDYFVKQEETR